jgi:hypothetical protein
MNLAVTARVLSYSNVVKMKLKYALSDLHIVQLHCAACAVASRILIEVGRSLGKTYNVIQSLLERIQDAGHVDTFGER